MKKITSRGSGILLHVSSLPSNYGIGTFGEEAYKFVDFLKIFGTNLLANITIRTNKLWRFPLSIIFYKCWKPLFYRFRYSCL